MVRAVDGMLKERYAILVSYFASLFCFEVQFMCASFLMMDQGPAWICIVIGWSLTYFWYSYCIRIYNRFKVMNNINVI